MESECNSAFWREMVNCRGVLALRQPAELALRALSAGGPDIAFYVGDRTPWYTQVKRRVPLVHGTGSEVQMKLEVELKPDIGEALLARARSEGLSLDQFAERALEALVKTGTAKASAPERVKAFEAFLAGLETDAVLPEETFQRENWYPDRP